MSMMKKEKLKEIPTKNYIILIVIFIVTFLLVYYLYRFYIVYSAYQKETPIIRTVLPEITDAELEHYIQEESSIVIYMCTASDDICRNFEKSFKKLILKKNLSTYITYVNLSNTDLTAFSNDFNNKYNYKQKLTDTYPALVVFENSEVRDIIQESKKERLTMYDVDQFLKRNKIGE